MIQLALRFHKLPFEIEQMTMPEIAEILAVLSREHQPKVEDQLLAIFGKPKLH